MFNGAPLTLHDQRQVIFKLTPGSIAFVGFTVFSPKLRRGMVPWKRSTKLRALSLGVQCQRPSSLFICCSSPPSLRVATVSCGDAYARGLHLLSVHCFYASSRLSILRDYRL